jgi:hypothetical protein
LTTAKADPDAASRPATPSTDAVPQRRFPAPDPAAANVPARGPSARAVRSTTKVSGPGTRTVTAATARKLR